METLIWGRLPFTKIFEVIFLLQKYLRFPKYWGRLPFAKILRSSSISQHIKVVFHLPNYSSRLPYVNCILCVVFYVLYSMYCILCIVFYALCSMNYFLCSLCILCNVQLFWRSISNFETGWSPTGRQTEQWTDRHCPM